MLRIPFPRLGLPLVVAIAALALPTSAQTIYGLDAMGGGGPPTVFEFTGGPGPGPCGYPSGPFGLPPFPVGPAACPGPLPFPGGFPGLDGDVAVNRLKNTVWVAGPFAVAEYTTAGVQLTGFPNPMPGTLTGLGCDSATGTLWLTDGFTYVGVLPGPCGAIPLPVAGPFPNPLPVAMTDISWDPHSGALWACFADGRVAHFPVGGLPTCVFPTAGMLPPPLTGLDIDVTTPGFASAVKCAIITNGPLMMRIDVTTSCTLGGPVLAAPSFAFPSPVMPIPAGPLSGIAFADHAVPYGVGTGPAIGYTGHAVVGTTNAITLAGAAPGTAGLFVDFGALCPPAVFKGLPLFVLPAILVGPLAHGGSITLPFAIAPATPLGVELHMQWISRSAAGVWESSPAQMLTISRP